MSKMKSYYFVMFEEESNYSYYRYSTDSFESTVAASELPKQYLGSHASKKQLRTPNTQQQFNLDIKAV